MDNGRISEAGTHVLSSSRFTTAPFSDASYAEAFVGMHSAVTDRLRVGAVIPIVTAWENGSSHSGLGNSVTYLEVSGANASDKSKISGGIQLEIPTAMHGFGDAHFLILPYFQGWKRLGRWEARVQAGWSKTLTGDHAHSPNHGLIINPHSNSEGLLRTEGSTTFSTKSLSFHPGLGLELIRDLVDPYASVVNGGGMIRMTWRRLDLQAQADFPLTDTRRYDQRYTLRASFPIGSAKEQKPSKS